MPSRSWTTARLAVAAFATIAGAGRGAGTDPVANAVQLEIRLVGAGSEGHEIEVRPGQAACSFEPIKIKVEKGREGQALRTKSFVVKTTSPDRDASFEIVLREPGRPDRCTRRGVRLVRPTLDDEAPKQSLTYYLSADSMVARAPNGPKAKEKVK